MYNRKTYDDFQLWSDYGYGWECETTYDSMKEAKQGLKEYKENTTAQHKIVVKRIRKEV